MKEITLFGKTVYILEQGVDFYSYELAGSQPSPCVEAGEPRTLKNRPISILQNVDDGPYDTSNGQVLWGKTIFNPDDGSETQIKISEMWTYGEPEWRTRYYEEELPELGRASARQLRDWWLFEFTETMDYDWSIHLINYLYYEYTRINETFMHDHVPGASTAPMGASLLADINAAAKYQLLYSADMDDPLQKGPLMFKSRGFAIQAFKHLMGIEGPGYFDYYFRSRINLKGHLITTKDGKTTIEIKYSNDDGRKGGARNQRLCGHAFLFINLTSKNEGQVPPSIQVELGDVLEAGDESYVIQNLFNVMGPTPSAEFLSWWNKLCDYYESLQNQYEEDAESSYDPPANYDENGVKFGIIPGVDLKIDTDGPGVFYVGGRFGFGTNPYTKGLWLGNLRFEVGVNPRNYANQIWGQMRARQQNYRSTVQQKTQTRVNNASAGATNPTDLDISQNRTSTPNGTRPSNTDAVHDSNKSGASNGGSDTRNSQNNPQAPGM